MNKITKNKRIEKYANFYCPHCKESIGTNNLNDTHYITYINARCVWCDKRINITWKASHGKYKPIKIPKFIRKKSEKL